MDTEPFADYFNDSDTADVKVVIKVVRNGENFLRRKLQLPSTVCKLGSANLCAHALMLMAHSPVWKANLERWQEAGEPKKITLIIDKGEEAAAYRLVQCLYTNCLPDIESEMDLHVILGILILADQYQVKAALSLCAKKVEMLTNLGVISWDLAARVMRLPAEYLEKPGLSCLVVKIQEKILKHAAAGETPLPGIGLDLEVVMRNSTLEKVLMALPLCNCATLLSDDRCHVASENTVAAAVVRRLAHEATRSGDGDTDHVACPKLRAEIMFDVIRIPHLTPLFAAAMPSFSSHLSTAVRPEMYALGLQLYRLPIDVRAQLTKNHPKCWLSKRRPHSTLTALEFEWEASVAELKEKFDSGASVLASSPSHFFAGMDWTLQSEVKVAPEGRRVGIFMYAAYPLRTKGPPFGATFSINISALDKKSLLHRECLCRHTANSGWGWSNFFDIPPMQKWDERLMQKWTSSKGFLTVRAKVSDVL